MILESRFTEYICTRIWQRFTVRMNILPTALQLNWHEVQSAINRMMNLCIYLGPRRLKIITESGIHQGLSNNDLCSMTCAIPLMSEQNTAANAMK